MNYDDLIDELGDFGPYQIYVYCLACLPALAAAIQTLIPVFILAAPKHRCKIPGYDNDTYEVQSPYHEQLINFTLKWTDLDKDDDTNDWGSAQCSVLENRSAAFFDPSSSYEDINSTVPCHAWVYDTSTFENSFVTQTNMICDDTTLKSHANMIYMSGLLVGSLLFGFLSDSFGRKRAFMIATFIHTVSAVSLTFSPNFVVFVILRFCTGVANMGMFMCSFVMGVELVGRKYRSQAGVLIQFYWVAGMFVMDGVAYALRDWQNLQLALSCYVAAFLSLWWLIPESPRWLMSKGRLEEAKKTLERVAQSNNTELPKDAFDKKGKSEAVKPTGKLTDLFVSKVLLFRLFVVFVNWIVVTMVYYGLTLNVGSVGGNVYLNFFINGLAEGLGNVAAIIALPRWGRKKFHCFSLILGGVACLCSMIPTLLGSTEAWVTLMLSNIGKFGATGGFTTIYIFTAELFPTSQRNSVVGASSMMARLGGMASPYIAELGTLVGGEFGSSLPYIVFGSSALVAGFLALTLPETLNKRLPETVEDAIHFGTDRYVDEEMELPELDEEEEKKAPQQNGGQHIEPSVSDEKGVENKAFEDDRL